MGIRPTSKFRNQPKDDLEWGRFVDQATATPAPGEVTDDSFANRTGLSVIGRATSTDGKPADINLGNGQFLVNRAGTLTGSLLQVADMPSAMATDAEVSAAIAALASVYAPLQTTGTYTGSFTGTATDPAPVIRWSLIGAHVDLYLPQSSAVSNTTAFTITGAPAGIRPTRAQTFLVRVQDNGAVSVGIATMGTNGTLTFGLGVTGAVFTGSGTKGIELGTYCYSRD